MSRTAVHASRLRRAFLIALLTLGAVLATLYILGRQGRAPEESPNPPAPAKSSEKEGVVASSDAFDFTQTMEGQPVFSLHGDSFTTGRDAIVELAGVRLEVFRDATRYSVAARTATYDPNTRNADLSGSVLLTGADGFEMASQQMRLERGGKWIEAEPPVEMAQSNRLRGTSGRLTFDIEADLLRLASPVKMVSAAPGAEPLTFETGAIEYDRGGRLIRLPDVVRVSRGDDRMQAGNGELFLSQDDNAPQLLAMRGGVAGHLLQSAGDLPAGRRILVQATRLSIRFAEGGRAVPEEATLDGHGRDLALIESVGGEDELIQGLASRGWVVRFVDGKPHEAESSAPVHFAEYRRGIEEPVRSGRADAGRAEIAAGGTVERIALTGAVSIEDPNFKATGDRALFDVGVGRAEILGPQARVTTARGDLSAPHLIYSRASGLLTGKDGVRAVLRDEAGGSLSGLGWSSREPIQIESRYATLQEAPRTFSFEGGVRAWQGRNLLLADQLHGEEETGRLSASGSVRTIWYPVSSAENARAGADAADTSAVEVHAKTLTYRRDEARLTYEGDVRVSRSARSFTCRTLVADLDDGNRIRKMVGEGAVHLDDPSGGRTVDGERAEYDVATGEVLVTGNPVNMKDAQGAVIRGRRLLYDLKSGAARLLGADS